jgi:hypothetical protein
MDTIDTLKEAQKKGGKNRWNNIPEKKRKEMMREIALKRWAKKA